MKSTKNLLITGIALAITLFTSVQITAMELNKPVNPYLTEYQKNRLKLFFYTAKQSIDLFSQGAEAPSESSFNKKKYAQYIQLEEQRIKRIKEIYYGNRAYTDNEISNIVYPNF